MNILFLTSHLNTGGIAHYVLSLSKGLKNKGHNVFVASSGGELLPKFIEYGIGYINIPIKTKCEISWNIGFSFLKILPFITENKIDIVHANTRVTQMLGFLIERFIHRPFISTCHGFFKKRFSRAVFPCWGKKVVAISAQVEEHLIKDFKVDKKNIALIYSGIDLKKFPEPAQKITLKEPPVIGIIARLSEEKGHIYLVDAMKMVLDKFPSAQLLIIGEGRMKQKLVSLVRTLGIEKNVFFISQIQNTSEGLSNMDIFVMPSLKEGLGLALMEAMASGLPVIGSAVGGIKTLIKNNYNGIMVEPADSQALAKAIIDLLQDSIKRQYLSVNARSYIKENFSYEKMIAQTEAVYSEIMLKYG